MRRDPAVRPSGRTPAHRTRESPGGGPDTGSEAQPVLFFGLHVVLILTLTVTLMVAAVIGMVRAGRFEEFRYPLTVRLVKP
jgi:hypothetical protein